MPQSSPRTPSSERPEAHPLWDPAICLGLIDTLWALRRSMLDSEVHHAEALAQVATQQLESARNLVHFLAMRNMDLRALQGQLAWLGLSSLGRSESHVLASVDKVLGLLHRLTGQEWHDRSAQEPVGSVTGPILLRRHTETLLGPTSKGRPVRIMVTLGNEAATDYHMVRELVDAGMDVARINCAHDDAKAWKAMARHVRRAAKAAQREVKVLMDLGGPKIRTGPLPAGPKVLKLRPVRDELGYPVQPWRLHLRPCPIQDVSTCTDAQVWVDEDWLARLRVGRQIHLSDARGKKRRMLVVQADDRGVVAEGMETCYLTPDTPLSFKGTHGRRMYTAYPDGIEATPGMLRLVSGDLLQVLADPQAAGAADHEPTALRISCTLPQVIAQVHVGERMWLDDGRIGGVVREASAEKLTVEMVQARAGGEKLMADKGINFPDSELDLPALSAKDLKDLQAVAKIADLVGMSFVQQPDDVHQLLQSLQALHAGHVGVVLKIETRQGFENLPELMLAAMAAPSAGVMIARGDLAVECGYERMAEVQEEILWCSEAAHMPVIWATQVLETLAKTGVPSRAEISDASMGVRAECVMLNKGTYITDAIHMLDDILRRMAGHQAKKTPLLRALRAWSGTDAPA